MVEMPVIDREKCNGCGLCVSLCRCNAVIMVNNVATIVETEECHWCTECEAICPTGAIGCSYQIVVEDKLDTGR